jgi:hypothetical protein
MISKLKLVDQNVCHNGKSSNRRTKKKLVGLFLYTGRANELKMFIKIPPPSGSRKEQGGGGGCKHV